MALQNADIILHGMNYETFVEQLRKDLFNDNGYVFNKFLTFQQTMDFLGFSRAHLYRLIRTGEIPFKQRGSKKFFLREELEEWIATGDTLQEFDIDNLNDEF
ncbi:helix-turn-helix domain-containing protein [Flammeovirga sp. SubArs3]|uniref:helix-turn-helix domain-containing protein n=1 Tax=Flammeovirga sp. SubArs3 TaxID=2995316 RepID=UPI00248AB1DA|nr:helix-turn-helix domain-containing protein [Flammeovirga sp. SubArs3]